MHFPNWYVWLLATLGVAIMGRFLYGIAFVSTEERVRAYFTKTTNARRTRRQEKLLLQAIRGAADSNDSANLGALISFCTLMGAFVIFACARLLESDNQNISEQLRIQGTLPAIKAQSIESLQGQYHSNETIILVSLGVVPIFLAVTLWMETYVVSMIRKRRQLAFWHQRMKQALFALASPDEIRSLVQIEAQVKTPLAVAAYLNYAITIAVALSIPEVTDPLDIWGLRAEMEKRSA